MTRLIDFEREGATHFALYWRRELSVCAHFIQFPASKGNLYGFIYLNFCLFIQQISGWAYTHACIVHTVHIHDIQLKILIKKPKYLCYSHLKATENWCHFTWNLCDRARHKQKDESISMNFLGGVCSHFMFCHYLLHVHATQQSFE